MITFLEKRFYDDTRVYARLAGLSSDTLPGNLVTGSEFRAGDTGVVSYYDEASGAWYPTTVSSKTALTGATVALGSSLTYDGTEQTQSVSSVKIGSTTLTASTDYEVKNNKATLPGTYTLLIVGKGTYTGVLQEEFTVAKASGSIEASPDTFSFTEGDEASDSTLTVTGDGVITVSNSDAAVASAVLADDTLTVTPLAAGSATITVTLADGELYEGGSDTTSVTVTAPEPDPEPEPGD